jgi:uncharacterized membrane protein
MKRFALAASTLSAALGLAVAMTSTVGAAEMPGNMPQVVKDNMMRAQRYHLEKCYGINAVSKNDCAEGAHSCAGQATVVRDTKSFVLLPHGGGSTTAS